MKNTNSPSKSIDSLPLPEFQRRFLQLNGTDKFNFLTVEINQASDDLKASFFSFVLDEQIRQNQVHDHQVLNRVHQTLKIQWPLIQNMATAQTLALSQGLKVANQVDNICKVTPKKIINQTVKGIATSIRRNLSPNQRSNQEILPNNPAQVD